MLLAKSGCVTEGFGFVNKAWRLGIWAYNKLTWW